MKIKRLAQFRPLALCALGVFLGRGAQADTTIDFGALPPGQVNNCNGACCGIFQSFGDNAAASSEGVTVTGSGTPNIGLTWEANGAPDTKWDYYLTWVTDPGAGQLNNSDVGYFHDLTFTPNNPSASVVIESFNFFPWYVSTERFTYNVSVLSGTTVLSGPIPITFVSDGMKDHPVTINYTGAPGQTLKLRIARLASTLGAGEIEGGPYNIAVDDIKFAQLPVTALPAGPQVVLSTPPADQTNMVAVYDPPVMPVDDQSGLPAVYYPYRASITNGDTTLVTNSIRLSIDGNPVSPPPSVATGGGLTTVSSPGTNLLASSGWHLYRLTYTDNVGGTYTNDTVFNSSYLTLPAAYALPSGAGVVRGFTFRTVSANLQATNMDSTVARAIAQLNGTLTNPATSLPYTNEATLGTNADGSFSIDTVLNFNDDGLDEGDFPNDQLFPGMTALLSDWFSTEASLFLNLPAGYYRLGVNSDDGFEVNALPPQGVSGPPIVLGVFDAGRAAADTLFDVLVPTPGVYTFQVIYFQNQGRSTEEFFSVTNLATGDKVLVNDVTDANAIKSYRVLAPRITSIVQSGSNVVIQWAYGNPPFQVQFKSHLNDPSWSNIGSPTSSRTANVPISGSAGFLRVYGQ